MLLNYWPGADYEFPREPRIPSSRGNQSLPDYLDVPSIHKETSATIHSPLSPGQPNSFSSSLSSHGSWSNILTNSGVKFIMNSASEMRLNARIANTEVRCLVVLAVPVLNISRAAPIQPHPTSTPRISLVFYHLLGHVWNCLFLQLKYLLIWYCSFTSTHFFTNCFSKTNSHTP